MRSAVAKRIVRIGLAGLWVTACSPSRETTGEHWGIRDSAGVTLVENYLVPRELGVVLDQARSITFDHLVLNRVHGLRILHDGGVAIANAGMDQLLLVDTVARQPVVVGREGDGPGEFQAMSAVFGCRSDTLVVWEGSRALGSVFDRRGQYVRRDRIFPRGIGRPWDAVGIADDCASWAVLRQERTPEKGRITAQPLTVLWFDPGKEGVTEVASLPGLEAALLPDIGYARMPFGNMPVFAVRGSELYTGSGKSPEIRVYDQAGRIRSMIRWRAERVQISPLEKERYERTLARLRERDGPTMWFGFRAMSEYAVRDKPLYAKLLLDDAGLMWLQKYPRVWAGFEDFDEGEDPDPAEWWIFAPSGELLASASTPPGLRLYDIRAGWAAGIRTSADGTEQLEVLPFSSNLRELLQARPPS